MNSIKIPTVWIPFWFSTAVMALSASASTTGFDDLAEGPLGGLGDPFTDGGITFFDPDAYLDGDPGIFVIENADDTLGGPFFSPPNTLTMTGYSPGSGATFSRIGEFKMTTGQSEFCASVELFFFLPDGVNTVNLEALLEGVPVATDTITPSGSNIRHYTLSITDVEFDTLRVFGDGPNNLGAFFALLDNVVIDNCGLVCDGDVNEDQVVDPLDSGYVLSRLGCEVGTGDPDCDAADANLDGIVDPLDVGYVLSRFGECS